MFSAVAAAALGGVAVVVAVVVALVAVSFVRQQQLFMTQLGVTVILPL